MTRGLPQDGQRVPVLNWVVQSRQRLGIGGQIPQGTLSEYKSTDPMAMTDAHQNFAGATLALFVGDKLVLLHRDDKPGLLWPGYWDMPGGGREGAETPLDTALRETFEEFTLRIPPSFVHWGRAYTDSIGRTVWFFVGWIPGSSQSDIRLGDEGQGWALMSEPEFLSHPKAVPQFKARLLDYQRGVAPSANFKC
ncbi:MAG: NUDIX hydrolase [Aliishimia sp.]